MISTKTSPVPSTDSGRISAEEVAALREENAALKHRVAWFERQLFGQKSEKRPVENPHQGSLLGEPACETPAEGEKVTITYVRGKAAKQRPDDCVTDSGLRFSDEVPVEVIAIEAPQLSGPEADQFEIIATKSTFRLAQRPASYVVLRYDRPVIKRKGSDKPLPSQAPFNVLDKSIADVRSGPHKLDSAISAASGHAAILVASW